MNRRKRSDKGLALVIERSPSMTRLAESVGVSLSALSQWNRVPAERVLRVEQATGVPRHKLRPDIYPKK
jgi:DNA-binding transcriptional regulator YdaS (Cro superfamily)